MADYPALPLWTDAYLADLHPRLSLEEHGCMILLMQFAWRSPECKFRDDDKFIARMLSITVKRWKNKLRPVMEEIWTVENGAWEQKRLTKERQFVANRQQTMSDRGRKGGIAKALKPKETDLLEPDAKQTTSQAPTPTPIREEEKDNQEVIQKGNVVSEKPPTKKGTRLPDDWEPSNKLVKWAEGENIDLLTVERETAKFKDWWPAQPGQKGLKLCWDRTWKNWIRTAKERLPANRPRPGASNGFTELMIRKMQ